MTSSTVDAGRRELLEAAPRLVDALLERERDLAVVLERLDRLLGIVFTVSRPDQLLDVEDVAVGRVLGRGRGPEAPLLRRALRLERLPALAREDLLPVLVRELRVRDGEPALQLVVAADRVEPLVRLGVDARDEEARDRRDRRADRRPPRRAARSRGCRPPSPRGGAASEKISVTLIDLPARDHLLDRAAGRASSPGSSRTGSACRPARAAARLGDRRRRCRTASVGSTSIET